jgi:hypothetical protein
MEVDLVGPRPYDSGFVCEWLTMLFSLLVLVIPIKEPYLYSVLSFAFIGILYRPKGYDIDSNNSTWQCSRQKWQEHNRINFVSESNRQKWKGD